MPFLSLFLALAAAAPAVAPAAWAQQDCVTGIHLFQGGSCTATVVNSCGKPLNCTIYVEGYTAGGAKVSDSKGIALPIGGSLAHAVSGVARCGDFDLQCNPAATPRRR
jgi:hypothetical protein